HEREFCFGPTHEEVITDLVRREVKSYKQLPLNYYQIQTKFRDEIRPRFGAMRAREFPMKDAHSFHLDHDSLTQPYQEMDDAYCRIFTRRGLEFRAVQADTGSIGGSYSHEFHVLADAGEDAIAISDSSDYAANVELAEAVAPAEPRPAPSEPLQQVDTPNAGTIEDVSKLLGVPPERCLKTLLVESAERELVDRVRGGGRQHSAGTAEKRAGSAGRRTAAAPDRARAAAGAGAGTLGPRGRQVRVVADRAAATPAAG